MTRKIRISISPLGDVTFEADGFEGQSCTAATEPLERALAGGKGMSREYKPEWNISEDEEQHEQEHQW